MFELSKIYKLLKKNPCPEDREFSEDEQAKQRYIYLGLFLFAPMQLSFFILNIFQGSTIESLFDLSSIAFYMVGLSFLCRENAIRVSSRIFIITILYVMVYSLFFNENETRATIIGFSMLPPLIFFLLGLKEGVLWVVLTFVPIALIILVPFVFHRNPVATAFVIHFAALFITISVFAFYTEFLRSRLWKTLYNANKELKEATKQLKTMEGLVPICSYCKNIRNDDGYWQNLESFLMQNSTAEISGGVCNDCINEGKANLTKNSPEVAFQKSSSFSFSKYYKEAKKKFFVFASSLGSIVILLFSFYDLSKGNLFSFSVQFISSMFLAGSSLYIWKRGGGRFIYNICVMFLFLVIVEPFFANNSEFYEISWFLILPVATTFLLEGYGGLMWSSILFVFLLILFMDPSYLSLPPFSADFKLNFSLIFISLIFISFLMAQLMVKYMKLIENKTKELQKTFDSIKTLKGFIPICSSCKSIRNDEGFWTNIEEYIQQNTELQLSHGVCRSCLKKEFPDIYDEIIEEEDKSSKD
jgi:hypothetical protein